jgi:hypothetical protein
LLVWIVTDSAVTAVTRPDAFWVAPDWALRTAWWARTIERMHVINVLMTSSKRSRT